MSGDRVLVERLVEHFPALQDLHEVNLSNNGALLPHVLFWDVTREVLRSYLGRTSVLPDWEALLGFLEAEYSRGDAQLKEVIVTSFLDTLPPAGEEGHDIVHRLGPELAAAYRDLHN